MEVILGKVSFNSGSFRLAAKFKMLVEERLRLTFKLAVHSTNLHCVSKSAMTCAADLSADGGNAISL